MMELVWGFLFGFLLEFWGASFFQCQMIHKGERSRNCTLENLVWTSGEKKNQRVVQQGRLLRKAAAFPSLEVFKSSAIKAMADLMVCWQWSC